MAGFGTGAFGSHAFAGEATSVIEVTSADGVTLTPAVTPEWYRAIADALALSASAIAQPGIGIGDRITLSATAQASALLLAAVTDNVALEDAALLAWEMALSDAVQLADAADTLRTLLQVAADRLRLVDAAPTSLHAAAAVIAGFALADQANPGFDITATDTATFADTALAIGTLLGTLSDSIALSDAAVGGLRLLVALDDALAMDAAAATQLTAFQAVSDALTVGFTVTIGGDDYFAFVLHPQPVDRAGTRPVTEYRNFPFNSFSDAEEGRYFAAGAGGIYELVGSDDAGAPIEAWIRSGLTNWGSGQLKRLPEVFLALRGADQALFLKTVTTSQDGTLVEDWFELVAAPAAATRETRARVAQGLKSVYWQYELRNIDGADFRIDELRFYPVVLEGKVI